jgi:cysteine-rich repeat protein
MQLQSPTVPFMRRLGLFLGLAACPSPPGGGEAGDDSTTSMSSSSSSEDGGVHTVTGEEESMTPGDETSTPSHSETSSTSTGDATTEDPDTGSTADPETTTGVPKDCGNGIVEGDEICDDGNEDNTDECTVYCQQPHCGDGLPAPNEACDDGNPDDDDECLSTCQVAFCGDGKTWVDEEQCDDGNASETDACLPTCKEAKCGDAKVWAGNEVCDDGFNDGDYGGCKPGCQAKSDEFCGDGEVQPAYEHCDGASGMAGVGCDACLFDFATVPQMACNSTCTWGPQAGCGQDDADIFCKLRTGNPSAKAKAGWTTAPPTDLGGFACADMNVYIDLNGDDPRVWLGPLPQFGVTKNGAWQPTKIKSTHGLSPVLQASKVQCEVP